MYSFFKANGFTGNSKEGREKGTEPMKTQRKRPPPSRTSSFCGFPRHPHAKEDDSNGGVTSWRSGSCSSTPGFPWKSNTSHKNTRTKSLNQSLTPPAEPVCHTPPPQQSPPPPPHTHSCRRGGADELPVWESPLVLPNPNSCSRFARSSQTHGKHGRPRWVRCWNVVT